jgi:hypothetical protein
MKAAAVHQATSGLIVSLFDSRQWRAALSPMKSAAQAKTTTNHLICAPLAGNNIEQLGRRQRRGA